MENILANYESSDDSGVDIEDTKKAYEENRRKLVPLNSAPLVKTETALALPEHTFNKKDNHLTGHLEEKSFSVDQFRDAYYSQNTFGNSSKSVFAGSDQESKKIKKKIREERNKYGNPGKGDFMGPWASYKKEDALMDFKPDLTSEQMDILANLEKERERKTKEIDYEIADFEPSATFHMEEDPDYLGRIFLDVPTTTTTVRECYIPKKHMYTYKGHTKQVNRIKFLPRTGHLLLSASADCRIKLWDVNKNRQNLATYIGHTEMVKDIDFTQDGRRFISCGYDKKLCYWDTETGKLIRSISLKKLPICAILHPDRSTECLVGTATKRVDS